MVQPRLLQSVICGRRFSSAQRLPSLLKEVLICHCYGAAHLGSAAGGDGGWKPSPPVGSRHGNHDMVMATTTTNQDNQPIMATTRLATTISSISADLCELGFTTALGTVLYLDSNSQGIHRVPAQAALPRQKHTDFHNLGMYIRVHPSNLGFGKDPRPVATIKSSHDQPVAIQTQK